MLTAACMALLVIGIVAADKAGEFFSSDSCKPLREWIKRHV